MTKNVVTDCSFNVNESGNLEMLPQYATPYKDPKKFKNQMQHHLRFFRFNHRTHVPTGQDLSMDEFFAETHSKPKEDLPKIEETKSRPQKHSVERPEAPE